MTGPLYCSFFAPILVPKSRLTQNPTRRVAHGAPRGSAGCVLEALGGKLLWTPEATWSRVGWRTGAYPVAGRVERGGHAAGSRVGDRRPLGLESGGRPEPIRSRVGWGAGGHAVEGRVGDRRPLGLESGGGPGPIRPRVGWSAEAMRQVVGWETGGHLVSSRVGDRRLSGRGSGGARGPCGRGSGGRPEATWSRVGWNSILVVGS